MAQIIGGKCSENDNEIEYFGELLEKFPNSLVILAGKGFTGLGNEIWIHIP